MERPGGEIIIYRAENGGATLDVRLEGDTVWLTQKQIAELFQADRSVITKHIRNIFNCEELDKNSVCAKFAHTAADGKKYQTQYYNFDLILSVGYRVNSKRGTDFRVWATSVLRDHILKGYTINERRLTEQNERLQELNDVVKLLGQVVDRRELAHVEAEGLLRIITDYAYALSVLDDYDYQRLSIRNTVQKEPVRISYADARKAIDKMAEKMSSEDKSIGFFGVEKDDSFKGSLSSIYQTFGDKDVYPSIEEKAGHLLYFIVKNHCFTDGNKRIGAFIFALFLNANGLLYTQDGRKRINDSVLVALTLMIAESNPRNKDTIIKVVVNLINRDGLRSDRD
ncbi:MAG: RhuM family protein [bacterium]|nr:RhuM family protein [bacterium]